MSGSGGAGGYDYQADAFAFVATHAVCRHRLDWFDDFDDTPTAIRSETNGPGDDFGIETQGGSIIEVQAKHGLARGSKFDDTVHRIITGLVADPLLRGVLLVDSTTSGTIRNEFRNQVLRLADGRTDGIKEITQEILTKLSPLIGTEFEVFRRFRVIVADLSEGESGRGVATALLREVVADPVATSTAWDVFGKEGFRQMSRRGRRNVEALVRFLSTRVVLRRQTSNLSIANEAYRLWRVEASRRFYVPGVGVTLPIDRAWIGLQLLEEEGEAASPVNSIAKRVQTYHEWERLAENLSHKDRVEAEHLLAFNGRVVVIGGPGAGKSTLADRITWRAASEGKQVVKVRLKTIAAAMREGQTFDKALLLTAADSSSLSFEIASILLASPDILIADGLDEADPNRGSVARALVDWCASHPGCVVCVLTRPVGHESGLLPGFRHVELLPLDREAIEEHSRRMFESLVGSDQAVKHWAEFIRVLHDSSASHRAATLAARNPLLLGFLVRLQADGVPLGQNRAALYGQVIHLAHASKVGGREIESDLEEAVANRLLDILGWLITRKPDISQCDAIQEIGNHLESELAIPQLRAMQLAERGLRHWEERRLIERLTAGSHEAFVFLHPSLGEFAAARYAATLSDPELEAWLKEVWWEPRWRQPLLLAVGLGQSSRIVPWLITQDRPDEPTSTESVLAAAALMESGADDPDLSAGVVERLSARLTSFLPIVAVEAAAALWPLAAYASTAIGPIAAKLVDHPQSWTRLAGIALAIAAGREFITIDRLRSFLEQLEPTPAFHFGGNVPNLAMPVEAAELEYEASKAGLGILFQELPPEEAGLVAETVASSGNRTGRMVLAAETYLKRFNQHKALERIRERHLQQLNVRIPEDLFSTKLTRAATEAFLDAVRLATNGSCSTARARIDRPLLNLAAVNKAMRLMDVPIEDWLVIGHRDAEDVLAEVICATMIALEIDPALLEAEANEALERLGDRDALYHVLPSVTAKPDWSKCSNSKLDIVLLAKGLFHPCLGVVVNSAEALCLVDRKPEVTILIQRGLDEGSEKTLRILAHFIEPLWGKNGVEALLARLRQPFTEGCEHLFRPLVALANSDQLTAVWDVLRLGIQTGSLAIAKGAAEALSKSDLLKPKEAELHALLDHWTKCGNRCDRCVIQFAGKFCPKCHRGCPTPRAGLVRVLIDRHYLTVEELIQLCTDADSDVIKTASAALARIAVGKAELLRQILSDVNTGKAPNGILNDALALPASLLRPHRNLLKSLADSPTLSVRLAVIASLPSGWADTDLARKIAEAALNDPVPAVRTQAVRSLRTLV